jgi:serine/threonine protein kinase
MNQWAASVQGLQDRYDILGELGRAEDGALGLLARDRTTQQLVAVRIEAAPTGHPPKVVVTPALNSTVPAMQRSCPICKSNILDWRRFCAQCGADLSGVELRSNDAESRSLLERVLQASQKQLELIGQVNRAEGGGAVYFGYERESKRIVALDLLRQQAADGTSGYSFAVTSTVERTRLFDPAAFSAGPTPLPPAPRLDAAPPPLPQPDYTSPPVPAPQYTSPPVARPAHTPTPTPPPLTAALSNEPRKVCPACGAEYDAKTRFCPDDGSVLRAQGATDELIGEVIADRYHVLKKIGQGGMGQVYLAEHVRMGRRCAIKVMNRSLSQDTGAVSRFAREAANAARINDPNVAHIYDFGESKEHGIYLAMEYVEGEVLSRILERERVLPVERALRIAVQVTRALGAAHKEGVVHRDLTPNNIVVGNASGEIDLVKVVDFGIAKAMQDSGDGLTRTGFVVGTPRYMSPEQLLADPVDGRSDLYSLGCIMFEMLAGSHPFVGPDGSHQTSKRLSEPAPHPRERNPNIPPALDAVVVKALARNPGERFANAHDLRQAMEAAAVQGPERKFAWTGRKRQAGAAEAPTQSKPAATPVPEAAKPAPTPTPLPYSTPHDFAATVALGRIADELVPPSAPPPLELAEVTTPSAWAALDQVTAGVTPIATPQPKEEPKQIKPNAVKAGPPPPSGPGFMTVVSVRARSGALVAKRGVLSGGQKVVVLAGAAGAAIQRGARIAAQRIVLAARSLAGVWPHVVRLWDRVTALLASAWRSVVRMSKRGADAGWQGVSAGSRRAARLGKRGAEASARGVSAMSQGVVHAGQRSIDAGLQGVQSRLHGATGRLQDVSGLWSRVYASRRVMAAGVLVVAAAGIGTAMYASMGGQTVPVLASANAGILPAIVVSEPPPRPMGRLIFGISLPADAVVKVNGAVVPNPTDTLSLPAAAYAIEISAPGYDALRADVTVDAGVDFTLTQELRAAKPLDSIGGGAIAAIPPVTAPNAAFGESVRSELTRFRGLLQSKNFDTLLGFIPVRTVDELRAAIALAGSEPFRVVVHNVSVPDNTAIRAIFSLRITQPGADRTLLAGAFNATFLQTDARTWIIEHIERR